MHAMTASKWVSYFLLLGFIVLQQGPVRVSTILMETPPLPLEYQLGDNFWLKCGPGHSRSNTDVIVKFVINGRFFGPYITEVNSHSSHSLRFLEISENGELNTTIAKYVDGRYSITVLDKANHYYKLDISNLTKGEGGQFGCQVYFGSYSNPEEQYYNMTVLEPPSKLEWQIKINETTYEPVDKSQPLTLTEGVQPYLRCYMVMHTYQPQVDALISDPISGALIEDVDQLLTSLGYIEFIIHEGPYETCLLEEYSDTYSSNMSPHDRWMPEYRHDGSKMKCIAYGRGGYSDQSDTITLNIHYKPRINCETPHRDTNGTTIAFKCYVFSNPSASIKWYQHNGTNSEWGELGPGLSVQTYTETRPNASDYKVSILRGTERKSDTFFIEAENTIGSATQLGRLYIENSAKTYHCGYMHTLLLLAALLTLNI